MSTGNEKGEPKSRSDSEPRRSLVARKLEDCRWGAWPDEAVHRGHFDEGDTSPRCEVSVQGDEREWHHDSESAASREDGQPPRAELPRSLVDEERAELRSRKQRVRRFAQPWRERGRARSGKDRA